MTPPGGPLAGTRVVTTRDEPGRLDALLRSLGADVLHVPLIAIEDAPGEELVAELARLDRYDWVIVTSQHGASRVGAAVAAAPHVRTGAVGARTAEALADASGRAVTVVPGRQTAADLVAAMPDPEPTARRVLVAQADRADAVVATGLRDRGYDPRVVTAYVTRLRRPTDDERREVERADVVVFASGSAAVAWAEAIGTWTPPHVVAIGPSTARVAAERGLQVTAIAADHSLEGLAAEVVNVLGGTT